MRKNMALDQISAREAIAIAACDVAGKNRPLSSSIAEEDRVYLYACPEDHDGKFRADDLAGRLERLQIDYGVNWDLDSPRFGLRFVPRNVSVPAEIKPFALDHARREWDAWKKVQQDMATVVASAASLAARGEHIVFAEEEGPVSGAVLRKGARKVDERN